MNTSTYNSNGTMPGLSPQRARVLLALGSDSSVTKLTALHQRIGNVHEVIRCLRLRGWEISTDTKRDINGQKYTTYKLKQEQHAAAIEAAMGSVRK